jgi:hypothetical protein
MTDSHTTGVWMTAQSATVLCWSPKLTERHLIDSTVPGRHRATGRAPTEEHPDSESHRDEHMRTFFEQVARVLPIDDDLLLVGDGEVIDHFAASVRSNDDRHGRARRVEVQKSGPITERQLVARIREFAGTPAKRYMPR